MYEETEQLSVEENFFLDSGLYVVSTPIGNMSDITLRAIDVLKRCDLLLCEDSRVSARLLKSLNIKKTILTYNDYSDENLRKKILDLIQNQNKALCLISDAGTPLISDPGYKLVNFLQENNIKITPVPGACSVIAALSISGIESDRFLFAGFIPNIKSQKEVFLKEFVNINSTLIFFESPHRVKSTLEVMLKTFGNRKAAVVREITKIYEEVKKDSLENLIKYYQENQIKGEVVILLSKPNLKNQELDLNKIDEEIILALQSMKPKDAVSLVAANYNLNKKVVYQRMLKVIEQKPKK